MYRCRRTDASNSATSLVAAGLLVALGMVYGAAPAFAHELWIETDMAGKTGQEQEVHVCWGHAGDKATGQSLQGQQDKLSARKLRPNGKSETLDLAIGVDSFTAKVVLTGPGYHVLGAELQTGIIDREFHGIPAKTRIVMYGKSVIHVEGSEQGLDARLGMDLEIVPVGQVVGLRPGDAVGAKLLLKGKPLGGRDAIISLGTSGPEPAAEAPDVEPRQWSIETNADPRTGEVLFPLIAPGPHLFFIRYFDESPGRYDGDLNHASEFSHLEKGDTYERTMYISTLSIDVEAE